MQILFKVQLAAIITVIFLSCSPATVQETHLTGPTMGTTYNVKFVPINGLDEKNIKHQIDQLLIEINQLMSTYINDSELSQFNQWNSTEPFTMSPQTIEVLNEAKRLGDMSSGLLDVTIGPLINLWGFGPQSRPEKIPSDELIQATQQLVGLDKLTIGPTWASKTIPNLYVDLSTIAKGYAVDQVAELLQTHKIQNFLVEIGGEMRISGLKASGIPWKIAIEKPQAQQRAVQEIISIGDNAVATSGDYRIYYEQDGIRYSHLINPNTGYPITHNVVSATVIHPSSMTADGLATALIVMGKDKALALATKYDIAVILITKEKDGFNEYTSARFEQLVTVY
ncbi:FAD:protein FMN transferase [Paraglaciecola arctica]|uniref:FAD:protein FMN transferase n=1 Tax=Paraglaciecola arctica BSs20135 TaxID=493475 RepID=K6Z6F6_9ALTE|nr:FAD:protein FMN transferase [Paraglaciecola arctica]GAC19025.1 thiamine biosynthesis lipoprotein [Paraglaciecola arctica BSs20135]